MSREAFDRPAIRPEAGSDGADLTPCVGSKRAVIDGNGRPVIERVDGITITDADVERQRYEHQR